MDPARDAEAEARRRGFLHIVAIPEPNIPAVVDRSHGTRDRAGDVYSAAGLWLAERQLFERQDWIELPRRITVAFRDERVAIEFRLRWG